MMVHGMCCTGEVWANFRRHFEAEGVSVYTPTLRPEQRVREQPPPELRTLSFDDYVADLERQARRIEAESGRRPAVIGPSMGGLLAQVLAERGCASAAGFISPTPPAGARTLQAAAVWAGIGVANKLGLVPGVIRPHRRSADRVVLNRVAREQRRAAHEGMVHESGRAFADMGSQRIDESKVRIPVLTVAATQDRLVPAAFVRRTARKYESVGGELREYKQHGHWLYDEPGWDEPASDILDWFRKHLR